MYDIDGNYIPGFGVSVTITKPRKKTKKDLRQVLKWTDFEEYEFVYIPDEYLPCYELRKVIHTINEDNEELKK